MINSSMLLKYSTFEHNLALSALIYENQAVIPWLVYVV